MDSQGNVSFALPLSIAEDGPDRFADIEVELPRLLDGLRSCPPVRAGNGTIPAVPGIYVLSEGRRPLYVGQTRNLRTRLRQHGGASSRENAASFAFILARNDARRHGGIDLNVTRKALETDRTFAQMFMDAKARVTAMDVRYVEVDEPELRTIFEVYATVMLGTSEYNSFETH